MSTELPPSNSTKGARFPVPRIASELQHEWAGLLAKRAGVSVREFLAAPDQHMNFPIETVRVELTDGSMVEFKYAFALVSEEWKAVGVFTEHCGHHVLPFHEAKVFQGGNSSTPRVMPNPSLHPKCYSRLHPLPHSGELKR